MSRPSRAMRLAAVMLSGGCLLQVVGCLSGLSPTFVSLAESAALWFLLGNAIAP